MNQELPDVQAGFRKGRGTRDQLANIHWITEKAKECQKNVYFCFVDYANAFDCMDQNNCGQFLKSWEYQTTLPASWETCMQVKKQQLELNMEQRTCPKLEKEYVKAVYFHPAYFNLHAGYIMQNAVLDEAQAGIKISRRNFQEKTSDMQMIPPLQQKEKSWMASPTQWTWVWASYRRW